MDARSLVGMTEGAKKRAARRTAFVAVPHGNDYLAWSRALADAQKAMRIGQRLRPCLGCSECVAYESEAMYFGMGWACDGSGVLSARRRTPLPLQVAADDSGEGDTYFVVPSPDERPCSLCGHPDDAHHVTGDCSDCGLGEPCGYESLPGANT